MKSTFHVAMDKPLRAGGLALLLLVSAIRAQTAADSLMAVWQDAQATDTARLDAVHALVTDHLMQLDVDSAATMAGGGCALAERSGEKGRWALLQLALGVAEVSTGDYEAAQEAYRTAQGAFEELADTAGIASVLRARGTLLYERGELSASVSALKHALSLYEQVGDKAQIMRVVSDLGRTMLDLGEVREALALYDRALRLSDALQDRAGQARALHELGSVHDSHGDHGKALDHYRRALRIYQELGNTRWQVHLHTLIGNSLTYLERYEEALVEFEACLQLARDLGFKQAVAYTHYNMAAVRQGQELYAEALELLGIGERLAREIGYTMLELACTYLKAGILADLGRHDEAIRLGEQALAQSRAIQSPQDELNTAEILYRSYRATGRDRQALEMLERHNELNDSLRNQETERAAIQQEVRYAYEKQALADSLEFAKREAVRNITLQKQRSDLARQRIALAAMVGGSLLIGLLAFSIFRGKKRSDELLLNILPQEVARELKDKGAADAKRIEQATVLFTDFKGFTTYAEGLPPEQVVHDLHECFTAFDNIIARHGMEKIKTIGDAYMAAGGLPAPNDTHAVDAVRAALEIRDFIAEGKARKIAAGKPFFEVRIGIHTGPVVAGIVGVKKFSYDIWGDTVNTASRMESSGEVGQVNISEATYKLVKNAVVTEDDVASTHRVDHNDDVLNDRRVRHAFTFTPRGKVQAKGKGELEMFFVRRSDEVA